MGSHNKGRIRQQKTKDQHPQQMERIISTQNHKDFHSQMIPNKIQEIHLFQRTDLLAPQKMAKRAE
jgi:hypothetical protein